MASVGGVSCTYVRGDIPGQRQRLAVWTVPGMNGYGAKRLGLGQSDFALELELKGTVAACNTWKYAIEALVGQVVTIINDWAETFTLCLVRSVGKPRKRAELGYGGVSTRLTLQGIKL